MVKFVESDTSGLPLKRKQVAHACSKCRQRKKRCTHVSTLSTLSPSKEPQRTLTVRRNQALSPSSLATTQPTSPSSHHEPGTSEGHAPRFVGDSNPEAIFMEATSLCLHRDVSAPGGFGVWQLAGVPASGSPSRQAVQKILKPYLWNHCLPCLPPPPDYAVLQRIYLQKLDPIFPILGDMSTASPADEVSRILPQQVISLAAAADPEATQHLRLSPAGAVLPRHEFCASLSNSIQTTLDVGLITDRILLTRITAALSLYTQPSSQEEADIPALLNSRAVHQMHTLGIQMAVDDANAKCEMIRTLFCCLWALDRLNAAFYGRTCLIHERDVGWDFDDCIERQAPPFRLFLLIIGLLDEVIGLYRPTNRHEKATLIELPIFEQMILDAGASRVSNSCLASLEIFYHSVAILSSQSPADGTRTALPAPATNSRRSLAADRITSIVGGEFLDQLSYMPFIPYGVSLSLSVSYRKMRHSKIPMFRNRGKQAFRANTILLKSLDDTFWTAKTIVEKAEQVLREMDKAVASLAQETGLTESSKRTAEPTSHREHQPSQSATVDPAAHDALQGSSDWSFLEAAPDLDVFGYFDPTFDLGAVDAALEGNLDFGASSNWFDWQ
ncbi:Uu.00g147130.m01.CDS01 [Anthostomella pinea]|uniref:Uu.00g147130.m01.CDS01 n=1 Tax=Anthostomella pinea TaxID=933095 RepID=A0AAI8VSJ4_9PEZI|nr:Uu.00g147130.m01.CDS01 [Anthostomella pinea]